jgi:hypothetical protein
MPELIAEGVKKLRTCKTVEDILKIIEQITFEISKEGISHISKFFEIMGEKLTLHHGINV